MKAAEFYTNLTYSLTKLVKDAMPVGAVYIDWDAHAEIHELPANSLLVGLAGASFSQENDEIDVSFSIGVATQQDPNLFVLRDTISRYYAIVRPEQKIDVYDVAGFSAGSHPDPVTWMVTTTPLQVLPINRAEIRNVQFINVSALLNPAALAFDE